MKKTPFITVATAIVLMLNLTACNKSSTEAPKPSTETSTTVSQTADAAKDLAAKAVETTKDAAKQVVAAATNAVASATGPFNDGVAAVKKFVADKNYQSALTELNKLSSLKLTDEQSKFVENLKAEVQASLSKGTTNAVNAVKGLFVK